MKAYPKLNLPLEISREVGYTPSMIYKINAGDAQPSVSQCRKIIKAMRKRGHKITLFDLRPDIQKILLETL
jgi:predicted transcriptional regulator